MPDFTHEDFKKIAKEVADHISRKRGLITDRWAPRHDPTWEKKRAHAAHVCFRFRRLFFLFGKLQPGPSKNGEAKEFIQAIEHPSVVLSSDGSDPLFSSNPKDRMNTPEYLKSIFDQFLYNYSPPDDINILGDHLWALHLFYSEIGYHLGCVPVSIPLRIDYALNLAACHALQKIKGKKIHEMRYSDSKIKTAKTKSIKKDLREKRLQCLAEGMNLSDKPYTDAHTLQNRWKEEYPNDKCPHEDTIVKSLRAMRAKRTNSTD